MDYFSEHFKDCFYHFPQFFRDFQTLEDNGFIKKTDSGYAWTTSETSLGQYFFDFKKTCKKPVKGGFWKPIETAFNIKRKSLRHLVSKNGRDIAKPSKDYEKIMAVLLPRREEIQNMHKFFRIKDIIDKTNPEYYKKLVQSLKKIENILFTKKPL